MRLASEDWDDDIYARVCREFKNGIYFANTTQASVIMMANNIWEEDRAKYGRNTCFKVVKEF